MLYSYEESVKRYGSKYLLEKAVSNGTIYRLEKGIYSDKPYVTEETVVVYKYPNAVLTLNSAFYYYNLTDVIPEKVYLATDRNAAKILDKRVVQIFERSELLDLGVVTVTRDEYNLRIYSKERLLIELLRHKSKLPFEYYKEILLNFREIIYDLNIRTIQDYANEVPKTQKIMETLQLEVL